MGHTAHDRIDKLAVSFMRLIASWLFSLSLRQINGLCRQGDDVGRTQSQHCMRSRDRYRWKVWTSYRKLGSTNRPLPTRPRWLYEYGRVPFINVLIELQVCEHFLKISLMVCILFKKKLSSPYWKTLYLDFRVFAICSLGISSWSNFHTYVLNDHETLDNTW